MQNAEWKMLSTVAWMQRSAIQDFHCPGLPPGDKGLVVDLTFVTTLGRVAIF